MRTSFAAALLAAGAAAIGAARPVQPDAFDVIIRNGIVYDGSGTPGRRVDVGLRGDRIAAVRDLSGAAAKVSVDAAGKAVAPGFINMLSQSHRSLLVDGQSQGEIRQGVTTQILGEGASMGPMSAGMKSRALAQMGDVKYPITWTTLAEYLRELDRHGVSQNVASMIGAATIREHVIGLDDRQPTAAELDRMRDLVRGEMEAGALGVSTALIYAPGAYARTEEIVELCKVAARYRGKYLTHMRSEGDRLLEAVDEAIRIAREAGLPAEIHHLKAAGTANWPKMDKAIDKIEAARREGLKITANMYAYDAGQTGLNSSMPPWVMDGGFEAAYTRLRDPETRKKIAAAVRAAGTDWENLYFAAGSADRVRLVDFKSAALKPLTGKTLAEAARLRGEDPVDTIMNLVLEDQSRVGTVYSMMSEANIRRQMALPWVSFGSDGTSMAPVPPFTGSSTHPRAYGNFARVLGKYVRDEQVLTLAEAIRKLSGLPATTLELDRRGFIREGFFADVVVFDPATIADRATYEQPHQYAVGMLHVFVNGVHVLRDGEHTGATPGRAVWGPGKVAQSSAEFDVVLRGGTVYDGSGAAGRVADVALRGDRIAAIGSLAGRTAGRTIDVSGLAVAPGFINMLSWSTESLLVDGRSQGEIRQGVTTQIMGEGNSMGPLNAGMKKRAVELMGDIKYDITWTTLAEYLQTLERRGVSQNVASFIGATTIREHVIGLEDRKPTPAQLDEMRALVRREMEAGALGIGSSLIYAPAFYASTEELIELCKVAAKYRGKYISHMRSEGNTLLEAVDELIRISREANIPAEIYHLKAAGQANWPKMDAVIARVDAARKSGLKITADMYTYPAGATSLDSVMPPWALAGGFQAAMKRLRDPATRQKIAAAIRAPGKDWENLYLASGSPDRVLLVEFKTQALKPLTGKSVADVAKLRNQDPVETMLDLLLEDDYRIGAVFFMMSEDNIRRQIALPWVSFGSDAGSMSPERPFTDSSTHPRAYGNFARLLGKYVRDEKVLPLSGAIRKLSGLPATNLELDRRGFLRENYFADVVVFDPAAIADRATFQAPHQFAVGMKHVFVNGVQVLRDGDHTGAKPGRAVYGPGKTAIPATAQSDEFGAVRARLTKAVANGETPSIAAGVIRNGALVWAEGFGLADREKKIAATPDTIYWLASVSKPLTATGLMQLVERSAIDLDKPANAYLGDARLTAYVGSADDMTIRRLANHTAGMPTHVNFLHGRQAPPMDESIRRYGFAALEPGKQVNYSNFAFGILGYIVERAAKTPWREYQEKHLYDPLKMRRTSDRIRPGFERDEAMPYVTDVGGRFMRYPRYDFDHRPASSIYSSVNDLSRFIRMHLNGGELDGVRVLKPDSVKEMQRITGEMRPGSGYGVSWQSMNMGGHNGLTHTGGMPGVSTLIAMFPAERAGIIVLTNGDNRQLGGEVARLLAQVLFPEMPPPPPAPAAAAPAPAAPPKPPERAPAAAIAGTWTGRLVHYDGDIPLRLSVNGDGSLDATFGTSPTERLTLPTISDTGITGRVDVAMHTQDTYHGVTNLRFSLSLRDGKLVGVATASAPFYQTLPYWVELKR